MKTVKKAVIFMAIVASCIGCEKKQTTQDVQPQEAKPTASAVTKTETPQGGGTFTTTAPAGIAGKAITPGGKGNVDRINKKQLVNEMKLSQKDGFALEGWAVDDKGKSVPADIIIQLEPTHGGTTYYAPGTRMKRPDVAKGLNEPAFANAGITLDATLGGVTPGHYQIKLLQITDSGVIATPIQRKINVQ